MGKSLTQNLMEYDSQTLDRQLQNLLPNTLHLTSKKTQTHEYQYSVIEEEKIQEFHQQQTDDSEQILAQQESNSSSLPRSKKLSKQSSANEKFYGDSTQSSSHSFQIHSQVFKRPRKAIAKKIQYPTKNFLPNFKVPHLNFIKKYYPNCMIDYPDIAKIQKKDGISLKDYEYLYRIPKLRPIFKKMFAQRILYRQLLLSRSDVNTKLIHQKKLHVFEEAYNSQTFERIN